MGRAIEADYDQIHMLPPCLEDWVGPEHAARFIRTFVAEAFANGLRLDWGSDKSQGKAHYGERLLLSVWLYGYFQHVKTLRRLEAACRNDLGMIWLCGTHAPDHNTLWRFFARNKDTIGNVYKHTVRIAAKAELVGFVLHALDGTKVQAQVANRSGIHRAALEKGLAELDSVIANLRASIEASHTAQADTPSTDLPEQLREKTRLRESVQLAFDELLASDTEHLNPHDPDARVMQCKDRNRNAFAYNNQAVVDEQSGLIVAQRTTQAPTDTHLLATMVQQVEDECGQSAQTTVADGGYAASAPLAQAQAAGHRVLVNLPSRLKPDPGDPLKTANFRFDPERNVVLCPLGQTLDYTHTRWHKNKGEHLRAYRCRNIDCPLRAQCSNDPKGRKIELGEHYEALQAQRDAHQAPDARQTLAKRRHIVEPAFGWIKEQLGLRRFTVRGLKGAQAQWALACTTYNLNRLYRAWKAGKLPLGHDPRDPNRPTNPPQTEQPTPIHRPNPEPRRLTCLLPRKTNRPTNSAHHGPQRLTAAKTTA